MAGRVSPTERLRAEIDELFASDRELASILEDVARLSVRSMMQTALEAEVEEFLGRARYQRRTDQGRPGARNGWQPPAAVKTTMGPPPPAVPAAPAPAWRPLGPARPAPPGRPRLEAGRQGVAQLPGMEMLQASFGVEDQDAAAGVTGPLGGAR